jgi:large subunit ribosomal protein L11
MKIKLMVDAGKMQPGPTLGQKLGPAGIGFDQVMKKVNEATKNFSGMKVPVELDVDPKTKEITVYVSSPPASELVKKEMGISKGSGLQKEMKSGNASIEQIISIAKTKMPNLLAKDLERAVKQILGTCVSLGMLVESKEPLEIIREIEEGKYQKEISEEKTETSEEKRKELDDFFNDLQRKQKEAEQKRLEAQKAEEEKKAEAKAGEGEVKAEETEEKKA